MVLPRGTLGEEATVPFYDLRVKRRRCLKDFV
jgi:hypothetical protein